MSIGADRDVPGEPAPTFRRLLHNRSFAVLFGAEVQSLVGDQLARVALAALVYEHTHSAAATALTYAATFLPAILGGVVLARLGDRLPRLEVMVGADILRAIAFTAMALPGTSLGLLEVLLVLAVFVEPAFTAAQASYLATRLTAAEYRTATGLRMATSQIAQIGGFAVGGALVAFVHPRGALAVDAVTFAASAAIITAGLRLTAGKGVVAAAQSFEPTGRETVGAQTAVPARRWQIRRQPRIMLLIELSALAGLFVVPEGLAIPYAAQIGQSTGVAGLLLAAIPAGGAVGALLLVRVVRPSGRNLAMAVMAVACGVPLLVTFWPLPWQVVLGAWFVSGAAAAYQVEVFTGLAEFTPDRYRSRTLGVASACLTGAQGVGLAIFGLVAQRADAGTAIALAGAVGIAAAFGVVANGHLRHAKISRVPAA